MPRAFSDFCTALSELLTSSHETGGVDSGHMANGILNALRALVTFDHSVTFSYAGNATPVNLFDTFNKTERHVYVTLYQQGPFLLDPFFRAAIERRSGFLRMRELAPDRFYSSDYFHNYYVQTGLAEEAGYFVPMPNGTSITLSLMRLRKSRVFSSRDIGLLRDASPLISTLLQRCWHDATAVKTTKGRVVRSAVNRLDGEWSAGAMGWRALQLTVREAAIVELVLQGHSSDAIAHRLCIARGTVKVHRRNAYRKLGITSQAELLATYMNHVMQQR